MPTIELQHVDIVFGRKQGAALAMLDGGESRDAILAQTGCVVGAAAVDLSVSRGEICVLMGLSGSGKSTVLRAINRLNAVTRGHVFVEHNSKPIDVTRCDVATLRELRMRTVATVFQQFALFPWRTVRENVVFGLELRGMERIERSRIVDEKLAMVGLSQWANKHTHELSGGMQQRVGLARAFATDADILLMDEPFSALDPLIREKLQDELLQLQKRLKKTIVFVSHDLDEAMKLGNRIAIMEAGRVMQFGSAEDILLRPVNGYVAEFVRHVNPLTVLSGSAIMTPLASLTRDSDGGIGGGLRLALDEAGCPKCSGDMVTAPESANLRDIIALKRRTIHPVLLVDELGRLAGLCGNDEIYSALVRSETIEGMVAQSATTPA